MPVDGYKQDTLFEAARRKLAELAPRISVLSPRERLAIPPQPMPERDPAERRRDIGEVALGYSPEQARVEAARCLGCANAPCVSGCPVGIDIPGFIRSVAEGDFAEAAEILRRDTLLPAVCGRVCPQETQCQAPCAVGRSLKDSGKSVAIGYLERFVADWERKNGDGGVPEIKPDTGRKVAVVGSGPAGIVVAADVRREGHAVTIFEAFHKPGGVMVYGIPEFRLPKEIVDKEIGTLLKMGVEIVPNFVVGKTRKLTDLMEKDGYDAVFIGVGAGLPRFMNIEGENLVGVFAANEYLTRANLMRAYDERADTPICEPGRVVVLGGGNVAMDAARTAVRLGAREVHVIYRRTEKEMPARVEEVAHAKEEGVAFHFLANAKRFVGDGEGNLKAIECLRYELGEPDASGRPRPVELENSEFIFEVDTAIIAIGNDSNPLLSRTTPELKCDSRGNIVVDDKQRTSIEGVYAAGDIVLGAATVILAMGEGRKAAAAINEYLET